MAGWNRMILGILIALAGTPVYGQSSAFDELPKRFVPLQPPTQRELDERQSLHFYTLGLLCEREDQLLEALRAYEQSAKLDAGAAAPVKAQIPILVALDRRPEALALSKKAVELDASDYESWFLRSRLLKNSGATGEAIAALARGLALPDLKDHPDMAQQMYLDLGTLQESLKDYEAAAESLAKAAKLFEHPDLGELSPFNPEFLQLRAAETYERIGQLYLQAKNYEAALAAYRQAQKRNPNGAGRINFNLAQVCVAKENLADAVKFLDAYLRLQPQGLDAYSLKMDVLKRLGREREILPWLEQASKADAFNVGLKMLLAGQYGAAKQADRAEKTYLELAERAPSAELYRGLFQLYRDQPDMGLDRALKLVNQALDKNPQAAVSVTTAQAKAMVGALRDDPVLAKDIVKLAFVRIDRDPNPKHETLYFLAVLADRNRQLEEAERFYRQSLREVTNNTEAIIYGGLLRVLWKGRKFQDIVKLCQEGLARAQATNRILFHNDLARAYARLGKTDLALAEADKAVNLAGDQDRLAMRHLRVRILAQAGKHDRALAECQAMLKDHTLPGDVQEIRYLLSTVYSAAKQQAKAEEQLRLILETDANSATANNDLGYMWADQGKNLKEAEEMIRKAIDLDRSVRLNRTTATEDGDNAAYIDSLGWVLFRRGFIEEARKELERAATLPDGDDPVIWDHLGDVYHRLGLMARARSAWLRAQQLYQQDARQTEDRYRDLQGKLQQLDQEAGARK